ncbi:hypothetical protein IFM89_009541 [Coptis chinensis]|uniref:Uncharacterized protein n=1 Tax=Coptis chinensis TaxID=261450 RepID=A0A835IBT2_9MAGN|nr:hypothetical protein IFM89_009541 [Coptis chinensis]
MLQILIKLFTMNKIVEFGRKFIFYARVLSGQAQERKAALRKIPEQTILTEVRRMVEEMQTLNKKLEETFLTLQRSKPQVSGTLTMVRLWRSHEGNASGTSKYLSRCLGTPTEAAIEDYFKPIDKEAAIMMDVQLKGEEKNMKEMVQVMQQQALLEKAELDKTAEALGEDANQHSMASGKDAEHCSNELGEDASRRPKLQVRMHHHRRKQNTSTWLCPTTLVMSPVE